VIAGDPERVGEEAHRREPAILRYGLERLYVLECLRRGPRRLVRRLGDGRKRDCSHHQRYGSRTFHVATSPSFTRARRRPAAITSRAPSSPRLHRRPSYTRGLRSPRLPQPHLRERIRTEAPGWGGLRQKKSPDLLWEARGTLGSVWPVIDQLPDGVRL